MEKNYYIVLPITIQNVANAYLFIESENFQNIGNNRIFEIIPNPKNAIFPAYRIELKEDLLSKTWLGEFDFETYLEAFNRLNAEIYESAEQYLVAYPPTETEF